MVYRFRGFRLDRDRRGIYFGDRVVRVTPKEFDLLAYMVANPGRPIGKDELIYQLWRTEAMSDAVLAQMVYRLRKSLYRADPSSECIVTIPSMGYQFVEPVETSGSTSANTHSPSARAFRAYRRAMYALSLRTNHSMTESLVHFEQAVALDPYFVAAHVGLAQAYAYLGEYLYLPADRAFTQARSAALRALTLEEHSAEAHAVLGEVYQFMERNLDAAGMEFRRALELAPHSVTVKLLAAWHAMFAGTGNTVALLQDALAIDPASLLLNTSLGVLMFYEGDVDGASAQLEDALLLDPDYALARYSIALVRAYQGRFPEALAMLDAIADAGYDTQSTALAGFVHARLGQTGAAHEAMGKLSHLAVGRRPTHFNRAIVLVGLGEHLEALRSLEAALEACEPWVLFLRRHPLLEPLREHADYAALLKRSGL